MKTGGKQGITLVELVVSMAVMSIVVMIAFGMYSSVSNSWNMGIRRFEIQQSVRIASEILTKEIRSAYSAVITQNSLQLKQPKNKNLSFYLSGSQIIRKSGNIGNPVANNIKNLEFSKEGQIVKIRIKAQLEDVSFSLTTAATLRGIMYHE
jgi:prepilin-type N-terminal cleavage/methylation domain-containing protein